MKTCHPTVSPMKGLCFTPKKLTVEIARPPVEAINFMNTYLAWFDHCDEDYSIAEKDRDAAKLYYSKKFHLTDGSLCIPQKEKTEK